MVLAVWSYLASLVILSVLAPVMGQQRWQVANPWSHGPLIKTPAGQQPRPQPNYQQPQPLPRPQPNYQQPQPLPRPQPNYQQPQPNYHQQPQPLPRPQPYYQQPPHPHPHPGYQPQAAPQHWNNQPAVAYQNPHPSAHSVAPAPAAPAPTSAAATPLEVEPLEVEGPTTPKLTPPPLPAYAYGPSPQAAPRPAWPAPTNQNAQPWGSPRGAKSQHTQPSGAQWTYNRPNMFGRPRTGVSTSYKGASKSPRILLVSETNNAPVAYNYNQGNVHSQPNYQYSSDRSPSYSGRQGYQPYPPGSGSMSYGYTGFNKTHSELANEMAQSILQSILGKSRLQLLGKKPTTAATTTTRKARVEPLEVEGPTTTPIPTTPAWSRQQQPVPASLWDNSWQRQAQQQQVQQRHPSVPQQTTSSLTPGRQRMNGLTPETIARIRQLNTAQKAQLMKAILNRVFQAGLQRKALPAQGQQIGGTHQVNTQWQNQQQSLQQQRQREQQLQQQRLQEQQWQQQRQREEQLQQQRLREQQLQQQKQWEQQMHQQRLREQQLQQQRQGHQQIAQEVWQTLQQLGHQNKQMSQQRQNELLLQRQRQQSGQQTPKLTSGNWTEQAQLRQTASQYRDWPTNPEPGSPQNQQNPLPGTRPSPQPIKPQSSWPVPEQSLSWQSPHRPQQAPSVQSSLDEQAQKPPKVLHLGPLPEQLLHPPSLSLWPQDVQPKTNPKPKPPPLPTPPPTPPPLTPSYLQQMYNVGPQEQPFQLNQQYSENTPPLFFQDAMSNHNVSFYRPTPRSDILDQIVAPPQPAYHGQPVHQPVAPHAHSGYSGQNYQGHYPVQPAAPQPQYQQVPQAAEAGNPLSRYDVFSSNFDAGAFQRAHYQAYASTTAAPIPLNLNSGGGGGGAAAAAGGAGNGAWSGREWANSFNSGGFNIGFPTTPPPLPPTTTPDHRVQINPYRHGGFYLGVPNPQERPKPVTEIIQIAQNDPNGPTMNPLNGWLGKTPPPALRPTTALPGKDGNVFAGFLGFHAEEPTTPPASKSINQINAKYQQYFAPVPVESANTQNGGGFQDGNLPRPQPNRPPQQGAVGATGLTDAQLKTEICNSFGMLCH